ncbi:capsid protein [Marmot astrovirus 5]|nr:capsid protein [Marmot astrovirus 5]
MAKPKANQNAKVTVTTTTTRGGARRLSRRMRRRRARAQRQQPNTQPAPSTTTTSRIVTVSNAPRTGRRNRPRGRRNTAGGAINQTVTATLGTVGANQGNNVETELVMLMNPALAKETTGSNQFGPIQMYAATYAQWKLTWLKATLTPLVGASAVSGTVVRISLNMTGNPTSSSWSALGARKHIDVTPGKKSTLTLSARDFPGPKEGWFNTNTKGDPNMSIGGSLEVHTLGKTMSTYQAVEFTGDLFLVEITANWQFRNYNPQPGLLNLVKGSAEPTDSGTVTLKAISGQPITMEVPNTNRFARAAGTSGNSEIIWQVADTTVSAISDAFPSPFNWLFKGGWWFLKRVLGAPTRAGTEVFTVYASIADARADVPCIATETKDVPMTTQNWDYTQVTPGNTGLSDTNASLARLAPVVLGGRFFMVSNFQQLPLSSGAQHRVAPGGLCWITPTQANAGGNNVLTYNPRDGFGFRAPDGTLASSVVTMSVVHLIGAKFYQENWVEPDVISVNNAPVMHFLNGATTQVGIACAGSYWETANFRVSNVLWKSTVSGDYAVFVGTQQTNNARAWSIQRTFTTTDTLPWFGSQIVASNITLGTQNVTLTAGNWYMLSFAVTRATGVTQRPAIQIGNLDIYANTTAMAGTGVVNTWLTATNVAAQAGAMCSMATPIVFEPFTDSQIVAPNTLSDEELLRELFLDDFEPETSEPEDAGVEDPDDLTGHYSEPPDTLLATLTVPGRALRDQLVRDTGLTLQAANKAAQSIFPHPAYTAWVQTYHDSLVDGLSPPTARDEAWHEAQDVLENRGHAE